MLLLLGSAALPAAKAKLEVNPSVIKEQLRQAGKIGITMPPIALRPKARSEILYAWWCWDIDPRPPECEILVCDDPIPEHPFCPSETETLEDGSLRLEFAAPGLLRQLGSACGPVGFSIMARFEDGSRAEAEGEVVVECEK
jgi:hypothetical protein